jgi:cysteinyl-tRNA synthetase
MDDDFNTPVALAVLFDLVREINRVRPMDEQAAAGMGAELRSLGEVLGILQGDPEAFLKGGRAATASAGLDAVMAFSDDKIDQMILQRLAARKAKQWAEADRIRDELGSAGILLEDGPGGTSWRRG